MSEQDKPVAWMWQHDETGRVGFVDQWQLDNGWEKTNPRLKVTAPLYARPAPPVAAPTVKDVLTVAELPALPEDAVHGRCAHWLQGFTFKHKRDPYPQEAWDAAIASDRAVERAHKIG